jgi:hypothetical protein
MTSLRRACGVSSFGRLLYYLPSRAGGFFVEANHVCKEVPEVDAARSQAGDVVAHESEGEEATAIGR